MSTSAASNVASSPGTPGEKEPVTLHVWQMKYWPDAYTKEPKLYWNAELFKLPRRVCGKGGTPTEAVARLLTRLDEIGYDLGRVNVVVTRADDEKGT